MGPRICTFSDTYEHFGGNLYVFRRNFDEAIDFQNLRDVGK